MRTRRHYKDSICSVVVGWCKNHPILLYVTRKEKRNMNKVKIKLQGLYIGEAVMTFEEIAKAEKEGFTVIRLDVDKRNKNF